MFVIERLIGISIYVFTLLAICYLIVRSQPRYTKRLMILYLACICAMAFLYVPAIEADLYRLTEYMFNYAILPLDEFILLLSESNTPASMLYFRIIGTTGIAGLLAGVTALIVFSNIFYIIYDYAKKTGASTRAVAFSIFITMSTGIYMQTISGIRNMLAFSILARCFYEETINKKSIIKNIVWYILACLIHPAAIAAVAIRLIVLVWDKIRGGQARSLLATIVSLTLAAFLSHYLGLSAYLDGAIFKLDTYTDNEIYSYFWDNVITYLMITFLLVSQWAHRKYQSHAIRKKYIQLVRLSYALMVFSLIFSFEHTIFVRFAQINLIVSLPIIINSATLLLQVTKKTGLTTSILHKMFWYTPPVILIISVTRGALSSLKFFD